MVENPKQESIDAAALIFLGPFIQIYHQNCHQKIEQEELEKCIVWLEKEGIHVEAQENGALTRLNLFSIGEIGTFMAYYRLKIKRFLSHLKRLDTERQLQGSLISLDYLNDLCCRGPREPGTTQTVARP